MPYKTTQEEHGLLTKWWGDTLASELIQMQEQAHANPKFDQMHYSIHDFSACDHFASDKNEVAYSSALDGAAFLTNPGIKIAVVGANSEVLAAVNAYMGYGHSPYPLRIFSIMEDARAWVMEPQPASPSRCIL
jgi:hypothetical protein